MTSPTPSTKRELGRLLATALKAHYPGSTASQEFLDDCLMFVDQYARAIAEEVIGIYETATQTSPDDDYDASDWERECQNQRDALKVEQRSRLDTLIPKAKEER